MSEKQSRFRPSRREILKTAALSIGAVVARPLMAGKPLVRIFDVARFGAVGDGKTLDSPAIQKAINEAAAHAGPAQVLVRGGKNYLVGTLELKGRIDFHLADDAKLIASLHKEDYQGTNISAADADLMSAVPGALIVANGAQGLKISGTGSLHGRATEFMKGYDKVNEIWQPREWRPKMFVLTSCRDLEVRDITFAEAPNWGLHMLGCDGVLVDNLTVRNLLDVPNCDGIDPDHSRNIEIRNCRIACGDDAIVVKASRQAKDYGPSENVSVRDCIIETQDAGLKIGTETTSDVHDVTFERCHIKTSSRGLCIQLRDEGSVYNVAFRDIAFESRYFGDPWWGRGEAISFTAIPRAPGSKLGSMHHITVQNVTGRAENSVRVRGSQASRPHDIVLDRVDVTFDRWTRYKGGLYDNRPTTASAAIEPHQTAGFSVQNADNVTLRDCRVRWGANVPAYFGNAIDTENLTGLKVERFTGSDAPARRT